LGRAIATERVLAQAILRGEETKNLQVRVFPAGVLCIGPRSSTGNVAPEKKRDTIKVFKQRSA